MPHIHEKIDFTVEAFVVHDSRVLLIFHKQLQKWLPLGGHIELDEDPEQALFREVKEESGLDIEVLAEKPNVAFEEKKLLYTPNYSDIHDISATHRHVGLVYFAKAMSDRIRLAPDEHEQICWFTEDDLENSDFAIMPDIKFYTKEALKRGK
jgi:8-oxo-dGTP pyrophosphatase MutT (NUDIX family)